MNSDTISPPFKLSFNHPLIEITEFMKRTLNINIPEKDIELILDLTNTSRTIAEYAWLQYGGNVTNAILYIRLIHQTSKL